MTKKERLFADDILKTYRKEIILESMLVDNYLEETKVYLLTKILYNTIAVESNAP